MNKVTIEEFSYPNGSYTITISNARSCMKKIHSYMKYFFNGQELFLGHYKKDGFNLSNAEIKKYETEIPEYFKSNGRFYQYEYKNRLGELTVCSIRFDSNVFDVLDKVFDYYLETIIFSPQIDWETFKYSFKYYMKHSARDYVLNGYTDFLFSYTDSGDFSVSFNPIKNSPETVRKKINSIFFDDESGNSLIDG